MVLPFNGELAGKIASGISFWLGGAVRLSTVRNPMETAHVDGRPRVETEKPARDVVHAVATQRRGSDQKGIPLGPRSVAVRGRARN
jgi:hypothetical protein